MPNAFESNDAGNGGASAARAADGAAQVWARTCRQILGMPAVATSADTGTAADSFKARMASLVPRIKAAAATVAGDQAKVKASEAVGFARKTDFVQAAVLLDEIDALLGPGAAGKTSVGSTSDPDAGTATAGGARTPRIAELLSQQRAALQALQDLTARSEQTSAAFETALAAWDTGGDADAEVQGVDAAPNAGEFLDRIQDVRIQAASLPEPAKSNLQARASQALEAAKGGDVAGLAASVEALESDLARASSAARVAEATGVAGDSVSFRRLQFEWRDAQERARRQLDRFIAAILADQEIQEDPRFEEVRASMGEAAFLLPESGSEIEAAIGAIDDAADEAARRTARAEARRVLAGYSSRLDAAEGLRQLQALSDDDYGGIPFLSDLKLAVGSLAAQLEN